MFDINEIIDMPPFSLDQNEKGGLYEQAMALLHDHHYASCESYMTIVDLLKYRWGYPPIPARMFKSHTLKSTEKVQRTVQSSGTSGLRSMVFLDKKNADDQRKVLVKIVQDFIGKKRLPMLVVESANSKGLAGIGALGFSVFGSDITLATNFGIVERFLLMNRGNKKLIFGGTPDIWAFFNNSDAKYLNFMDSLLIHGGGWKKLSDKKVSKQKFYETLNNEFSVEVRDYYGMAEQLGSIYMECEYGFFHCSIFSDIVMRDNNFKICDIGEAGIIQSISLVPTSYPGHNILTDDVGVIRGVDDCKCGRLGKYFDVLGRIEGVEIKGCSNV